MDPTRDVPSLILATIGSAPSEHDAPPPPSIASTSTTLVEAPFRAAEINCDNPQISALAGALVRFRGQRDAISELTTQMEVVGLSPAWVKKSVDDLTRAFEAAVGSEEGGAQMEDLLGVGDRIVAQIQRHLEQATVLAELEAELSHSAREVRRAELAVPAFFPGLSTSSDDREPVTPRALLGAAQEQVLRSWRSLSAGFLAQSIDAESWARTMERRAAAMAAQAIDDAAYLSSMMSPPVDTRGEKGPELLKALAVPANDHDRQT